MPPQYRTDTLCLTFRTLPPIFMALRYSPKWIWFVLTTRFRWHRRIFLRQPSLLTSGCSSTPVCPTASGTRRRPSSALWIPCSAAFLSAGRISTTSSLPVLLLRSTSPTCRLSSTGCRNLASGLTLTSVFWVFRHSPSWVTLFLLQEFCLFRTESLPFASFPCLKLSVNSDSFLV